MLTCKNCGKRMDALSMSDDEDLCHECFVEVLDSMDTNDESVETKHLSDEIMDTILASFRK